jgi:hypothetical protein
MGACSVRSVVGGGSDRARACHVGAKAVAASKPEGVDGGAMDACMHACSTRLVASDGGGSCLVRLVALALCRVEGGTGGRAPQHHRGRRVGRLQPHRGSRVGGLWSKMLGRDHIAKMLGRDKPSASIPQTVHQAYGPSVITPEHPMTN